jgi:hypothetical protein
MLPDLLKLYRGAGLAFVSLPEAESDPAYSRDPDVSVQGGGTLIDLEAKKLKIPVPFHANPSKELEEICTVPASK